MFMRAGGNPLAPWPLVTALVTLHVYVHVFQLCEFNPWPPKSLLLSIVERQVQNTGHR